MFLILHAIMPVRKERLSPMSIARREASPNRFMKKSRMPDRVKSLSETDRSKNCQRARIGFVKPI